MEESTAAPEQLKVSEPESTVESGESVEPADECGTEAESADAESTNNTEDGPVNPHLEEILKCPSNEWQLEKKAAVPFKSLEDTPFTIVDTKDLLDEMMTKLREVNEIGLATKRYTFRSFYGICSLVQIATRAEVFLVDAITLKDEVKVLSEILTNPGVLKVVHSGDEVFVDNMQKDLDIYMINLFSISAAWRTIHQTKKNKGVIGHSSSFGAQLKEHCDVDFNSFFKEYRKSPESRDWSDRPLTDGKIKCSRMEVQYLLHMYDIYRNLLIDMDLLKAVYTVCNNLCKSVWNPEKVALNPKLYLSLYKRLGEGTRSQKKAETPLNKVQLEVFKVLYDWRFTTALKHNESRSYLLRDMDMYSIASTLPKDIEGIKKCISPDEICPLLEDYYDHVRELIVNTVVEMASDPESNTMIPFFSPEEKKSLKRKVPAVRCHNCGKGTHTPGQTCAKKKISAKPLSNRGRGSHSTRPQNRKNPVGRMVGPMMGPGMGPRMGFRMGPKMGRQMGHRMGGPQMGHPMDHQMGGPWMGPGMGQQMWPRGMGPYDMGMYQPGPFYGW